MKKIITTILGILAITNIVTAQDAPATITLKFKNNTSVTHKENTIDSVVYVGGKWGEPGAIGMKIYLNTTGSSVDYLFSQVTDINYESGGDVDPNNKNANSSSKKYNRLKYMYNLEWPRIDDKGNSSWSVKSTDDYGVTLSVEWSNDVVANRWTCYQMHPGNSYSNVKRNDAFQEDPDLSYDTRSTLEDYRGSGFSRGHLCPSADRLCSAEQNMQTFYLSNMQPQWQSHNAGLWERIESRVREWNSNYYRDTLYVVKAATIAPVTINGNASAGVYNEKCNGRLPIPKYFYCALLSVKNGKYQALGLWTTHSDDAQTATTIKSCAISIEELERRTGIDFFCNLPDDIEETVEATINLSYWGL